ncbi:hypothetical protein HQ524_03570 [Candidatus Uhrbacteria bacterium]|nr:hypothetical protein [Candidatus Uhrbacteria bacterium]
MKKQNLRYIILTTIAVAAIYLISSLFSHLALSQYEDAKYGFSFSYPQSWVMSDMSNMGSSIAIALESKDTDKLLESKALPPEYRHNFALYHFDDINSIEAQGGTGPGSRFNYKSVDEFLNDTDTMRTTNKIGDVIIDDVPAHEVIVGGNGSAYGIMAEIKNDGIYLLLFERAVDKSFLGTKEAKLIESFKFKK